MAQYCVEILLAAETQMVVNYGKICILHMCYFNSIEADWKGLLPPSTKTKCQYISGLQFNSWFICARKTPRCIYEWKGTALYQVAFFRTFYCI